MGDAALNTFEAEQVYGIGSSLKKTPLTSTLTGSKDSVIQRHNDSNDSSTEPVVMSRQMRREQERKLAKEGKKGKTSGGFHRGG